MATITAADGTTIAFDDHPGGDETPVILVHGITETAATWKPLIERLTARRRVIVMDLRGHGRSGTAERYDLGEMAGDVVALASNLNIIRPHLVGHSLGGAVVSAVGAVLPVSSIINIDQSLQLDGFKAQLHEFEEQLRDPAAFPLAIQGLFEVMAGEKIDPDEMARINAQRRPDQNVVLGAWDLILTSSVEEITAVVATALAGYRGKHVDYLTLFGIDPGPGYAEWIASYIPGAVTEVWPGHGHYPHLVEQDRFVARAEKFWA
jgi:pimeloyl-ACP methyl ester carboxylesterase